MAEQPQDTSRDVAEPGARCVVHYPAMLVCCLGDLLVDVIVRLDQELSRGADATARTTLSPGGQAANVAAWVTALSGNARVIAKRGDDAAGRVLYAELEERGVEVLGPVVPDGTGVVVSLVARSGERTMCSDRREAPSLTPDEIDPSWLDGADHLHVSGYALARDPIRQAAFRAARLARQGGAVVSVDLASWSVIGDVGPARFRNWVSQLEPELVFANEQEDAIVGGALPGTRWMLKRGARGCSFDGDTRAAAPVRSVVDTTGAGDALAAGFIVGGPSLALDAAARCVERTGAMPPRHGATSSL